MNNTLYFQLLRAASIAFICICLFFLFKYTVMYIYPFLIAIVIAFLLNPFVSSIESRWRINRDIATFLVMSSFFTLFLIFFYIIIKQLLKESTNLVETLPEHFRNMNHVLSEIGQTLIIPYYEKLASTITILPQFNKKHIDHYLQHFIDQLSSSSSIFVKNIVITTSSILASLTYVGTILIFILLASFIITKDFHNLKLQYKKIATTKLTWQLTNIVSHLKKSVFGFIKAQIIITIVSSIIVFIGLFLFRVDNLFTITLTIFFVDFIPYVGIGVIFIPWIIYDFFTAQYVLTIQLAILYIIIIIVRQIIEPKILASSIGIHPLIAIIILFIGIQSLGIIGIFITPLILIAISAIYHAGIVHYIWSFIKKG